MRKRLMLAVALLGLAVPAVFAQNTDIESLAGINFNFANPGARSMGMGGAFLGLADDASAAEANPAGLTILRKREVSLEARHYRSVQELPVTGTFPDLEFQEFSSFSRAAEVQFGSIVVPFENFVVAAYYHQPLNYKMASAVLPEQNQFGQITQNVPDFFLPRGNPIASQPPISREECLRLPAGECLQGGVLPFITAVEVDLQTYALAGAMSLGRWSVGLTARYHEFEEAAFATRFFQGSLVNISVQATDLNLETQEVGAVHDFTAAAGFKFAFNEKLSFGGVLKQGPEFDAPLLVLNAGDEEFQVADDTKFHVPDIAGLGASFKPLPLLTINLDAVHVTYSNLVDDFRSKNLGIVLLEDPFEAKDVTEIHVGGEYLFVQRSPAVAIRAGWWRDPAHAMTYAGPLTCDDPNYPEDARLLCAANRITQKILFPEGRDLDHYTLGVGLAWPNFQIDAAYDTSEGFKVGSLSGVYRF
jgi:long-chain fatty acid transport protein